VSSLTTLFPSYSTDTCQHIANMHFQVTSSSMTIIIASILCIFTETPSFERSVRKALLAKDAASPAYFLDYDTTDCSGSPTGMSIVTQYSGGCQPTTYTCSQGQLQSCSAPSMSWLDNKEYLLTQRYSSPTCSNSPFEVEYNLLDGVCRELHSATPTLYNVYDNGCAKPATLSIPSPSDCASITSYTYAKLSLMSASSDVTLGVSGSTTSTTSSNNTIGNTTSVTGSNGAYSMKATFSVTAIVAALVAIF
jgi:hypothetical protein